MFEIAISTINNLKFDEIARHFKTYGILCTHLSDPKARPNDFKKYLKEHPKCLGIILEHTKLINYKTNLEIHNGDKALDTMSDVIHRSYLKLWTYTQDKGLRDFNYISSTDGYIDSSKKLYPVPADCYHWDDIFICKNTGYSIYETRKLLNLKISSRDLNVSKLIKEHIYYKQRIKLYYDNYIPQTGIIFDYNIPQKFTNLPRFLSNILNVTLNNGLFLRSAKNRREKLYWCPGLNSGIPFVPKSDDPVHESVFMFHDITHFNIPDLIFDGVISPQHKYVYVIYRLISEVFSLITADMVYVDHLQKKEIPYTTSDKRHIYQIWEYLNPQSNEDIISIYKIIYQYLFLNQSAYAEVDQFKEFKSKYDVYFLDDYKWTSDNWSDMVQYSDVFHQWYFDNIELFNELQLQTTSQFLNIFKYNLSHQKIFEYMLEIFIKSNLEGNASITLDDSNLRLARSYKRWVLGQLLIFYKFHFVTEAVNYKNAIKILLKTNVINNFSKIKKLFEEFLGLLLNKNLIDYDDYETYKTVYPLFKPTIVTYDPNDNALANRHQEFIYFLTSYLL
jgi:hypothetical protein